jgi:hypothetical protein
MPFDPVGRPLAIGAVGYFCNISASQTLHPEKGAGGLVARATSIALSGAKGNKKVR